MKKDWNDLSKDEKGAWLKREWGRRELYAEALLVSVVGLAVATVVVTVTVAVVP